MEAHHAKVEGVWAPVQTADELLDDPQALANGYVREVEVGRRDHVQDGRLTSPVRRDPARPDPGPDHGEHTDEVLEELGLDIEAILELKIKGAVL